MPRINFFKFRDKVARIFILGLLALFKLFVSFDLTVTKCRLGQLFMFFVYFVKNRQGVGAEMFGLSRRRHFSRA